VAQYYVIAVKRGKVDTEIIRTTSHRMYKDLMAVLCVWKPVSLLVDGISLSLKTLTGKHWTGRAFGREILEW